MQMTHDNSTAFLLLCALTHRAGGRLVIHADNFVSMPPGQLKISTELDGAIVLQYGDKSEALGGEA